MRSLTHSGTRSARLLLTALLGWVGSSGAVAMDLEDALDRSLTTLPGYLRIFAECQTANGLETVEIYGSGVVVSNGSEQLRVPAGAVQEALVALQSAGFAGMPDQFGGARVPDAGPPDREPAAAGLELLCRVELVIDEHSKQVVQLSRGEESPELWALANGLLGLRQSAEPVGRATSLSDGLSKVGGGELAAETVDVLFLRKPDRVDTGESCLLRISGGRGEGRSGESTATIGGEEIVLLAQGLAALALDELPGNLFSMEYTDLRLRVLDRQIVVQSRAFSGMGPTTLGDPQRHYDRATALLESLCPTRDADGQDDQAR